MCKVANSAWSMLNTCSNPRVGNLAASSERSQPHGSHGPPHAEAAPAFLVSAKFWGLLVCGLDLSRDHSSFNATVVLHLEEIINYTVLPC